MVLPCDLISELAGITLLETWMVQAAGTIGSPTLPGALGVWFPTKGEHAVKGEETNFVITAQLPPSTVFPHADSLRPNLSKLVYATTTDTLNDITEDKKCLPIRHGLLRKHGRIRTLTTTRDAHIYLFPYWTLDFINQNPTFDSIGEDIVGWWAKASWQDGLVPKLGLDKILSHPPTTSNTSSKDAENTSQTYTTIEDEIDLLSMSSTHISNLLTLPSTPPTSPNKQKPPGPTVPPFLAYIHPSPTPLIRRIDTPALLLHTSLHLASLPPSTPPTPTPTPTPSPHAHPLKYHPTASIAPRTTISADTLIAANTTIAQHSNIKNCVIGAGCTIGAGARLTRCVVMDEVEVGEKVVMTGAVVGSRARVGKGCVLLEGTEVQPGFCVEEGTEGGKGEKFMGFEGLEDDVKAIGGEEEEDMGGEGIEMDVDEGENGREHMM